MLVLFAALWLLISPAAQAQTPTAPPKSFLLYGSPPTNDYDVVVWPWDPTVTHAAGEFQARIAAGVPPSSCFFITRAVTWHDGTSSPYDIIMIGKADIKGYGGDYITPTIAYGNSMTDSGWFPVDTRPLFVQPGDEIHIHMSGVGSGGYANIFYLPTACP